MLDIQSYRENEAFAKSSIDNWRISFAYDTEYWKSIGIPLRLDNIKQIRMFLDAMHEDRFDSYMTEMEGMTESELNNFLDIIKQSVLFQNQLFPNKPAILPFDTFMAAFIIFSRIMKLKPNLNNILEIGPGCGYLSFFLGRVNSLKKYYQIEVMESFYLLQHHINEFVFKDSFEQMNVFQNDANCFFPQIYSDIKCNRRNQLKFYVQNDIKEKKCKQFPWWKIGDIYEEDIEFDIITANANLHEMKKEALYSYLILITKKLKKDGYFFMHCSGSQHFTDNEKLLEILFDFKIAPIFLGQNILDKNGKEKHLTVINGVFVTENHPLFKDAYNKENYKLKSKISNKNIYKHFFEDKGDSKYFSKEDIAKRFSAFSTDSYTKIFFLNSIEHIKSKISKEKNKKIAIWGINTKIFKKKILKELDSLKVTAFLDINSSLWNKKINNVMVYEPEFYLQNEFPEIIIITAKSSQQIIEYIRKHYFNTQLKKNIDIEIIVYN